MQPAVMTVARVNFQKAMYVWQLIKGAVLYPVSRYCCVN